MRDWHFILFIIVLMFSVSCASLETRRSQPTQNTLYDRIVIELYSTTTSRHSPEAIKILKAKMEEYRICRADQIFVVSQTPSAVSNIAWNSDLLRALEARERTLHDRKPKDRFLIIWIAYVPGIYVVPNRLNTVGLKYGNTSIAIFQKGFNSSYEASILVHELGHIIGLVDRSKRSDPPVNPNRPNHCNNQNCVMFWRVNPAGKFDGKCQRDIRALTKRE